MEYQQHFYNDRGGHPFNSEPGSRLTPQLNSNSHSRGPSPGVAPTLSGAPSSSHLVGPRSGSISSRRRRSLPNPGPELLAHPSDEENNQGGLVSQAPPSEDFVHEILAINTLAMQRTKVESLGEAMEMLTEVYDKLSSDDAEAIVGDLQMLDQLRATTLNNMGVTECRRGQPRKALSHFEGARQLEEKWNIASPSVVLNTCAAYNTLQIYDKATSAALETIEMLRTLELQKKWCRKQAKEGEKDVRQGIGFLRDASRAPSTISSKFQGSGGGSQAPGMGRKGVSLNSSRIPKTSAERKAAKEEEAMLNAAAFPTIARSENAALWGAAWHNLGVAQLNLAQQAKDQSEYSNALAIFENAMRTTYDKLGTKHPMSVDVTATFRSVRDILLKNGAYKPHRTMKHAVLPPVDPRVQLLENLKVEPEDGESHARALENQRKNLSITFRGEVTKGKKLVERVDPTPYPGGEYEPFQQRSLRRSHHHGRHGHGHRFLRGALQEDIASALPFSPTLLAATKIYGNPHPLLEAGVGANSLEWIQDAGNGKEDEKHRSPLSSARRRGKSKRTKREEKRSRRTRSLRARNAVERNHPMEGEGGAPYGYHDPLAGEDKGGRGTGSGGNRGRHAGGGRGSSGQYTFLSKCNSSRSHSLPLSQRSRPLSEEEEQKNGRRTAEGAKEGRMMMMMRGGGGASVQEVLTGVGKGDATYPPRSLEQFYGSEIPQPSKMTPPHGGGGTHYMSSSQPPAYITNSHSDAMEGQTPSYGNPRRISLVGPPQPVREGALLNPSSGLGGYASPTSLQPLPLLSSPSQPPGAMGTMSRQEGGGTHKQPDGTLAYGRVEGRLLPPLSGSEGPYRTPMAGRVSNDVLPSHVTQDWERTEERDPRGAGGNGVPLTGFTESPFEIYSERREAPATLAPDGGQSWPSYAAGNGVVAGPPPPSLSSSLSPQGTSRTAGGGTPQEGGEGGGEMWAQSKLLLLAGPPAYPFSKDGGKGIQYHHLVLSPCAVAPCSSEATMEVTVGHSHSTGTPSLSPLPPTTLPPPPRITGHTTTTEKGPSLPAPGHPSQPSPLPPSSKEVVLEAPFVPSPAQRGTTPPPLSAPPPLTTGGTLTVEVEISQRVADAVRHLTPSSLPGATTGTEGSTTPYVRQGGVPQSGHTSTSNGGVVNLLLPGQDHSSSYGAPAGGGPNELFGAMWVMADPRLLPVSKGDVLHMPSYPEEAGGERGSHTISGNEAEGAQVLEITEDGTPAPDATSFHGKRPIGPTVHSKAALMIYSDEDGGRSSSASTEPLSQMYSRS